MCSTTITPSTEALCASIGPRTTSPIAYTFDKAVRQHSSTTIKPCSSNARPTPSALRSAVLGTRPVTTNTQTTNNTKTPTQTHTNKKTEKKKNETTHTNTARQKTKPNARN